MSQQTQDHHSKYERRRADSLDLGPTSANRGFLLALMYLLFAAGMLVIIVTIANAQMKSVEDFPAVHNSRLRLRLIEGRHGVGIAGARLTLTGGYDERDLKLKMWTAEIQTDEQGEAALPRMIANLPLLTVKGARLAACEGKPKQGYYSIEEIRNQGLSTINGCGTSRSETDPGVFTLVVERKSGDAKLEKKRELQTLKDDDAKNNRKIYKTNGTLVSTATAANTIDPAQLSFTAPRTLLQPPVSVTSANPLKPSLFALATRPTLVTGIHESSPVHQPTPDLDTIYISVPTSSSPAPSSTAPDPVHSALSAIGMAGGHRSAALHKSSSIHHAAKRTVLKAAAQKQSPTPGKKSSPNAPASFAKDKTSASQGKPESKPQSSSAPAPAKAAAQPAEPSAKPAKPSAALVKSALPQAKSSPAPSQPSPAQSKPAPPASAAIPNKAPLPGK